MIRGILMILPMTLIACTAPITDPPAHACSPRLDGGETFCPPHDFELEEKDKVTLPQEELRGDLDVYDATHWLSIQHMFMRNARRQQIEENMTQPDDALNSALADYWEQEYGSNDTTQSEELLQLPSNRNQEGT